MSLLLVKSLPVPPPGKSFSRSVESRLLCLLGSRGEFSPELLWMLLDETASDHPTDYGFPPGIQLYHPIQRQQDVVGSDVSVDSLMYVQYINAQ